MSSEERESITLTIRKWAIGSVITVMLAFSGAIGTTIYFVNHTNSTIEEHNEKLKKIDDSLLRHDVTIQSKVSAEEMREFKTDMKEDMRDIKTSLNILLEKR